MFNSKKVLKRIGALAACATMLLSSTAAIAAGNITWQVKDYITTTGFSGTAGNGLGTGQGGAPLTPAYEIVYEQYLDGVATGYVVSGDDAREYGLKGYASSITRPVSWYDKTYPNYQYEEIYADGEYTGLVWPTGAQLPYTAYKDFRYMWEVGGTHREVAETRAYLNNQWYSDGWSYPKKYTGSNADVIEENKYFGFDVFEIFEDGKARDVEVVLDTAGEGVNTTNSVKRDHMINAASANTVAGGSITGLVNSGSGYNSVFYAMLAKRNPVAYWEKDGNKIPVYDFSNESSKVFDDSLPVQHYFHLSGPTYDSEGNIAEKYGKVINAYEDCVSATAEWTGTGSWDYKVDNSRYSNYTNNLITTHATVKATTDWVYGGYELAEPYRIYEYLSIEGIVFDGDIDNNGSYDTPAVFRYLKSGTSNITKPVGDENSTSGLFNPNKTSYGLADPRVEWRYAWVEVNYPHEIYVQKYVEGLDGKMIATQEFKGTEKYAKENMAAEVHPANGVPSVHKHYQMRLEWRDNETRQLYVTPYFDINEHAGEYVELSISPDPSYIGAYDYKLPGSQVFLDPKTIESLNDND